MTVPFDRRHGLVVVKSRLTGPSGRRLVDLAVDTGATRSMISADMLRSVGYDLGQATRINRILTAGGAVDVPVMQVRRLSACSVICNELAVTCQQMELPAPIEGFLGLDFFSGCRITIDLRASTIAVD